MLSDMGTRQPSWVWVPPAGWPSPPAHWVPPPGWQPDPSWPSPHAGHQFRHRTPAGRRCFLATVSTVVIVVAAFAFAATEFVAHNPVIWAATNDTYGVQIVNDTSVPVSIGLCEDDFCKQLAPGAETVRPGSSFLQNVQANTVTALRVWSHAGQKGPWQCRDLTVSSAISKHYALSSLTPCASTTD